MLILPREHRAPFIAPGRRNRKVHWNRQRSLAIASLGKFEREDWRRSLWLPESLRAFYPKWNNQFSPGGGSGCGCCEVAAGCCLSEPDEFLVEIGTVADGTCTDCVTAYSEQSFVTTYESTCLWKYLFPAGEACSPSGVSRIEVGFDSIVSGVIAVHAVHQPFPTEFRFMRWQLSESFPYDCASVTALDIPLTLNSGVCTGTPTCTLTAL